MANRLPGVLILDDEPETVRRLAEPLRGRANANVLHPGDLTEEDLENVDLILVDYRLQHWPERDLMNSIALMPMNGLALAGVIRAHFVPAAAELNSQQRPVAIALHSAHLGDVAKHLPVEVRAHVVARANNLEWAFEKIEPKSQIGSLADQLLSMADAVRLLPSDWSIEPDQINQRAKELLRLPQDEPWTDQAWVEVEECHPPLHELSEASHGLALLRWLLHRILPYPCFLIDEWHLAARLGVEHRGLSLALENVAALSALFEPFSYSGILSDFLGKRWWRAGVEQFLWNLADAESSDLKLIQRRLKEQTDANLEPSKTPSPLVCIGENYLPLPALCTASESVRIQPDDWPPFAEQAWTTIEVAQQNQLFRSLVLHADKERLGPSHSNLDDGPES